MTQDRFANLTKVIDAEHIAISRHEDEKQTVEKEINKIKQSIDELQDEQKNLNELLEEKTKVLEGVKRTSTKSAKILDQALKDIASRVCIYL